MLGVSQADVVSSRPIRRFGDSHRCRTLCCIDERAATIRIAPATDSLPRDLARLSTEATAAGVRNVATLIEQWENGTERFDRGGESLLVAWSPETADGDAVGVGGLTHCPHVPGALRVRRFYVAVRHRRHGIATALARQLVVSGLDHTDTLTCNARASPAAAPFWESIGFEPVDVDGITHVLDTVGGLHSAHGTGTRAHDRP